MYEHILKSQLKKKTLGQSCNKLGKGKDQMNLPEIKTNKKQKTNQRKEIGRIESHVLSMHQKDSQ